MRKSANIVMLIRNIGDEMKNISFIMSCLALILSCIALEMVSRVEVIRFEGTPGKVTWLSDGGFIKGVDTTGEPLGETWESGDIVYLSTERAGCLTNIKPVSDTDLSVGVVFESAKDGWIYVYQ